MTSSDGPWTPPGVDRAVPSVARTVTEAHAAPVSRVVWTVHRPTLIEDFPAHAHAGLPPHLRPRAAMRRQGVALTTIGAVVGVALWQIGEPFWIAGPVAGVTVLGGIMVIAGVGRGRWVGRFAKQVWARAEPRFPDGAHITVELVEHGGLALRTPAGSVALPLERLAGVTRTDRTLFVWVRDGWGFVPVDASRLVHGDIDGFAAAALHAMEHPASSELPQPSADAVLAEMRLPGSFGHALRVVLWWTLFGGSSIPLWLLLFGLTGGVLAWWLGPTFLALPAIVAAWVVAIVVGQWRAARTAHRPRHGVV